MLVGEGWGQLKGSDGLVEITLDGFGEPPICKVN